MIHTANPVIEGLADLFARSKRTPVLRHPGEYGLAYEDVGFPSSDGTPLDAWFIPADSDRLVICNHFAPGNRYGFPGHLEPWNAIADFEVNFLPEYKVLHEASYNILTYDFRNHGRSAAGNGGLVGNGALEYRDVVGSIRYAKSRQDTANMRTVLRSVCIGANATIIAMGKHPQEFEHIRAMVAPQPVSGRAFIQRATESADIENGPALFDEAFHRMTGFHLDELSPLDYAPAVKVPTLVTQVRDDAWSYPWDVQAIFDRLGSESKELYWIEGSTRRYDGYNWLGQHPERMLEWFAKHI